MEETVDRLRRRPRRTPLQTVAIIAVLATYGINLSQEHVEFFAIRLMERQMRYITDHPALQVRERVSLSSILIHFITPHRMPYQKLLGKKAGDDGSHRRNARVNTAIFENGRSI
jgi:hypothetical protein